MSTITIFKDSKALIGNHEADSSAICIVTCDDSYDEKLLSVIGNTALDAIKNKSKGWKFFVEFNDL